MIESTLCKFTDNTKLGGAADAPECQAAFQRDLDKLEKWAERNLMKFVKGKSKVLSQGRENPMHYYTLCVGFAKNLVIMGDKLVMS